MAIAQFSGIEAMQEPVAEIMAAAIIVTFPLVALVLIFRDRIAAGLSAGAVNRALSPRQRHAGVGTPAVQLANARR